MCIVMHCNGASLFVTRQDCISVADVWRTKPFYDCSEAHCLLGVKTACLLPTYSALSHFVVALKVTMTWEKKVKVVK